MTYTNQDASVSIGGVHIDFLEKISEPPLHIAAKKYQAVQDAGETKAIVDIGDETNVPEIDIEFIATQDTKSILTLAIGSTTTLVVNLGVMTLTYSNAIVKNTKLSYDKDIKGTITLILTEDPVVS